MNTTHMSHTASAHASTQGLENQTYFRGIITKLLHEAFYLEEDFVLGTSANDNSDFIVAEPEEDCEQLSFIHHFLKLRT